MNIANGCPVIRSGEGVETIQAFAEYLRDRKRRAEAG